MKIVSLLPPLLAISLAPILPGVINRTKAFFAGRNGTPLLQTYFDIWKLLHKGAVYSGTTTGLFRMGPMVALASLLTAAALMPFAGVPALLAFPGDLLLFVYLICLMRFFTVLAALDTGSSFEGMGASREVFFSALAEPALLLALVAVAGQTGRTSFTSIFDGSLMIIWPQQGIVLLLVVGALTVVWLAENARIPVDDPNTHLELTMIHEVMVLDHGGPDLAFILYGAALKLWLLGALLVSVLLPLRTGYEVLDLAVAVAGMFVLAIVIGSIESAMARLRLPRVPQLLVGASVLAILALILGSR